jgi:phosphoribosylglycinamide formyltransferase 1
MKPAQRIVWVGSTGGAVLSQLLPLPEVQAATLEVVSDRPCGFLDVARRFSTPAVLLPATSGSAFSALLHERHANRRDVLFVSFYTRLFNGEFLQAQAGRILNFHPSLLPAFKGMRGFEDTWASGATEMGSTVHWVDAGMDTGPIFMQQALPIDRSQPMAQARHQLFLLQVQQAQALVQCLSQGLIT